MKKLDETAFTERELKIFKEIQEFENFEVHLEKYTIYRKRSRPTRLASI